jgi:homogentisate 1,2-dioxygenase
VERGRFKVRIKSNQGFVNYYYGWHPFDLIGWDGYLYPYAINMRDFEPVTRRIHTMPDEQQIFETQGAAICCLVKRLLDYHPDAIPAPPYHLSIDVDEIVFNMGERFMGWTRPSLGVVTFHPRGIVHGPKPGSYEASIGMKEFDGTAIMVDSVKPLKLTRFAQECDDPTYSTIWREQAGDKSSIKE